MTEPTEAAIEAAAREAFRRRGVARHWDLLEQCEREAWLDDARAILRAAQAATPEAPHGRHMTADERAVLREAFQASARFIDEPEGEVVERRRYWAVARSQGEAGYWCTDWAEFFDEAVRGDLADKRDEAGWRADLLSEQGKPVEVVAVDITVRRLPTVTTTTADVGDAT